MKYQKILKRQKKQKILQKKDEIKSDVANTKNVSENNSDKVDNNKGLEKTEVISDKVDNNKGLEKTEVISDNSLISSEKKSNKKVLIITLLSILLVIDVAALVIYLIGIEKVISFIK